MTLDGTPSYDPNHKPLKYHWTFVSAPAESTARLDSTEIAAPRLTPDVPGDYVYSLTVDNGSDTSNALEFRVSTTDGRPHAEAGAPMWLTASTWTQLDGSRSYERQGAPLQYQWSVIYSSLGASVPLFDDAASPCPKMIAPAGGTFVVQLTVSNGSSVDRSTVLLSTDAAVPLPPELALSAPRMLPVGQSALLDASQSNGYYARLTFSWALLSKPAASKASLSVQSDRSTLVPDVEGDYIVQVSLKTSTGFHRVRTVLITAGLGGRPSADAGPAQSAVPDSKISFDGSRSTGATPERALSYQWSLLYAPGPNSGLINAASPVALFSPWFGGTYVVQLAVYNGRFTTYDTTVLTVATPSLAGVSPTVLNAGVNTLTITGSNTHFNASTTVQVGSGAIAGAIQIVSPTSLRIPITVPSTTLDGDLPITISTPRTGFAETFTTKVSVFKDNFGVTPASGPQGRTITVMAWPIYGTTYPPSQVSFGPGITVLSVGSVDADFNLPITIDIANDAAPGLRTLTIGSRFIRRSGFRVVAGTSAVLSVAPGTGDQGDSLGVTIDTSLLSLNLETTTVDFGPGIQVTRLALLNSHQLQADLRIARDAQSGPRNLTVSAGGVVKTLANAFTVTRHAFADPDWGFARQVNVFSIYSSEGDFRQGVTTVNFGDYATPLNVKVLDSTRLQVTMQDKGASGARDFTVSTGSSVIRGSYTVYGSMAASPSTLLQGYSLQTVTLVTESDIGLNNRYISPDFGAGVTLNSGTWLDQRTFRAVLTVANNAAPGPRTVQLSVPQGPAFRTSINIQSTTTNFWCDGCSIAVGSTRTITIQATQGKFSIWQVTVDLGPGITVSNPQVIDDYHMSYTVNVDKGLSPGTRDLVITYNGRAVTLPGAFTIR